MWKGPSIAVHTILFHQWSRSVYHYISLLKEMIRAILTLQSQCVKISDMPSDMPFLRYMHVLGQSSENLKMYNLYKLSITLNIEFCHNP